MEKIYTDGELLKKVSNALNFDNEKLGLNPTYWVGNNDCSGMDESQRPVMPNMEY